MEEQEQEIELLRVNSNQILVNLEGVYAQLFMDPESEIRYASYKEALRDDTKTCEEWIDQEYEDIEADLSNAIISLVIAGMRPQFKEVHNLILQRMLERGTDALNVSREEYSNYVKALGHNLQEEKEVE